MAPGRKTGGRTKGTPNHSTAALREYTGQFSVPAIDGIWQLASNSDTPPAVRLDAYKEILNRSHGRASQAVEPQVTVAALSRLSDEEFARRDRESLERFEAALEERRRQALPATVTGAT